ncbi:hypothetical protein [Actinomadura rubrisoli]|uniref:hypothetical protein n=1 Tax=Actinomadura rubrisoli TaxID=2530368 RepID=UPI001FB6213F|nr:hypothetical protein [Actinomadura rubrisoli]
MAGRYEYRYAYVKADHLTELTMPAAGGLPAETLTATYSPLTGTPRTLTSDFGGEYTYVKRNYYWSTGEIAQRDYGKLGGIARSYDFDDPTGRITRIRAITGNDTGERKPLQDDTYAYTPAGLVSQITETLTESADGSQGPQRQCFTYDGTNRLTQAWTTTSTTSRDCGGGIDGADGRGPDPYKLAYEYTDSGNISTVTDNGAKRTYTYPAPGSNAVHPHSVTKITGSSGTDTYGYDEAGQMKTRTVAGKTTSFDWDKAHRLIQATTGGTATGMVYTAGGDRLIRRDGTTSTLYLDGMEVRATGASVNATRYYTLNGATVALRKNGDPAATWMMGDTQGSA